MDLRYLQSFVAVVDHGSMAEAARRLDLTPAAVAARVHALEEDLGAALIKRAGRSVRPTESGIRLLDPARAVLREARDLRAIACAGALPGELKLGVFVSAMTSMLPPVLKELYWEYPDLQVLVTPGNSVELCRLVAAGSLDAAFVVEPQFAIGKTCDWHCLLEEPLVVVAPPRLAGHDPLQLLRTEPFIRYDRTVLGGQLADRFLRDHGIRPRERLEIDGLMAVATLVAQGLGVALLPDWGPMWAGSLPISRIALPGRAPVRRVGLVWAKHGPRTSLAQAVIAKAESIFGATGQARRSKARRSSTAPACATTTVN